MIAAKPVLIAIAAALALGACGKKGDLVQPEGREATYPRLYPAGAVDPESLIHLPIRQPREAPDTVERDDDTTDAIIMRRASRRGAERR